MKHAVNFRLNKQTTNILAILEKKMHTSKTEIVEKAIELFAKEKLTHKHALLKFAGTLSETDADKMLETITTEKHNKKSEFSL